MGSAAISTAAGKPAAGPAAAGSSGGMGKVASAAAGSSGGVGRGVAALQGYNPMLLDAGQGLSPAADAAAYMMGTASWAGGDLL